MKKNITSLLKSSKNIFLSTFYNLKSNFRNTNDYFEIATNYANSNSFSSSTTYFIWVDKNNFKIGVKGLYFGVNKGYKCKYYTQFYGNYLFHSIIYNLNGSIRDGRLCMELSDGCIRLSLNNAKWIYDNIPKNTFVHIS